MVVDRFNQLKLHDRIIIRIEHGVENKSIVFYLDNYERLEFTGVMSFKSESYFSSDHITTDKLYIAESSIRTSSYFIDLVKDSFRLDGTAKWGEEDEIRFKFRSYEMYHFHLYCVDWDFDIVATNFVYGL